MTAARILHVDDEPDIREVVEISLALDPEFETRSCGSGQEALVLAVEWPPDIIVLDVMMPVMDGPTTLARLRSNINTVDIPVVFMTARAQSRELTLIQSLGASGVIAKPFDPMTLAASVRSYIVPKGDILATLREAFLQRMAGDAATLAEHRPTINGTAPADVLVEIRDLAHGLAGSGGIYGYAAVSDAGSALEETVIAAEADGNVAPVANAVDHLLACIATITEPSHSRLDA